MWLLDTVALSETFKTRPNPGFVDWLSHRPDDRIHTSVLCLGEIRRGVEKLPGGEKRAAIESWLENDLSARLAQRILPVGEREAQQWGRWSAGRTRPTTDTLIAATALVHGLTIVTRNVRDFDGLGIAVVNPWT